MKAIDLHTHSHCSDGTLSPSELVELAAKKELAAVALTDHDCISGISEAQQAGKSAGIEVIPGVELSTEWKCCDIHVVGLYIDVANKKLNEFLEDFKASRDARNEKMCSLIKDGEGFDISYEKLKAAYPDAIITRAHYARYLLDKGYTKSMNEAFDRYIGDYSQYYVPREKITPEEGIELIHEAGGTAVLAHPILYKFSSKNLEKLTSNLKEAGLDAIEAIYSTYAPSDEREVRALAKKYDLKLSGGSDFHGSNKPHIDLGTGCGHLFVPCDLLDELRPE